MGYRRMKSVVKTPNHFCPVFFAWGDIIELFFDFGSKIIIHNGSKVGDQKVIDNHTYISRNEFTLISTYILCEFLFLDFIFDQGEL